MQTPPPPGSTTAYRRDMGRLFSELIFKVTKVTKVTRINGGRTLEACTLFLPKLAEETEEGYFARRHRPLTAPTYSRAADTSYNLLEEE